MRKIIKNISFGLLTAGLIVGTALPTFAAYDEASGDAAQQECIVKAFESSSIKLTEMQAQQECIVKLDLMEVHLMLR